jgi:hypothetical protein
LARALAFQDKLLAASQGGPVGWIGVAKQLAGQRSGVFLGGPRPPVPAAPEDAGAALWPGLETALSELTELTEAG